ncbi:MAG: hypothetical protein GY856_25850, partial [bacterium]|nr:hypothetical protein [bacterium]
MLAVFPGGFDATGAGVVWDLAAAAAEKVLGGELLRVSLVEHRDGRYRLHDLARDFAAARLEPDEGDTTGRRQARIAGTSSPCAHSPLVSHSSCRATRSCTTAGSPTEAAATVAGANREGSSDCQ